MPLSIVQPSKRPVRAAVVTKAALRAADALGLSGRRPCPVHGVLANANGPGYARDHQLRRTDKVRLAPSCCRLYAWRR